VDDETFVFASFRLIPAQRMLLDDGEPLRLGSRALDILITLVEHAGETVSKEQLIARAWPDTVVDEGALRVHVSALRKALGDGRAGRRYVANNPGRGYSFVAPVTREHAHPETASQNGAAESNNLPASIMRIIGRDDIIAALATQLARRRFLTIVGSGGIGKTTVAVAVADAARASYKDGTWFVGLASLSDPDLVASALSTAGAVGVTAEARARLTRGAAARVPRRKPPAERYSWAMPARAQSSSCCDVPPPTPQAPSMTPLRMIGTAPWPMIISPPEAAAMPRGVG
jgi:DNA-binding winged helix-turn-helix (wHTH) protein